MRRSRAGTSFKQAVLGIPELAHALRDGLKALAKNDRQRISCNDSRAIIGSINLEESLHFRHPNEPLWDYGIGLRVINSADNVKWIEVHPASSTHVDELLKKLHWLRNWLQNSAPKLDALPCEFVWIASGKVHLQKGSPQMKKLYQAGMRFAGERFALDV
ncbi:MAG: hypothetical protein ACREOI_26065 [bacterium]